MRPDGTAVVAAAIVAAILLIYFLAARGPARRMGLTGSDGSEVSVDVEVADNPVTRAKGLMGRASLGWNDGMLFVFDTPGIYGFWMFNTTIPLEGIFIGENGTVAEILPLEPCGLNVTNCPMYRPKSPAKYVLEVNRGFCARHRIAPGSRAMATLPQK